MKDRIIIANSSGFWGDDPTAPKRQVEGGPIDYLVMDFLAEVTMAILQKQRAARPESGFTADFVLQLRDILSTCVSRGIRIITNAGGVNPLACRAAVETLAKELGLADRVRVAVVLGDDLFPSLDALLAAGEPLNNMDTGKPLSDVRARVLSANAYIGAAGLVKALELDANVIIAGRVADAAVTLAPMMYEFGWSATDWDKLAAGVVAGHIIECGTQCTGGNFTDWTLVKSYRNMGFPLVEAHADGTFVVTKHPRTGGLVSTHTVSEQILYEIGPPGYLSPDVVARFDSVSLNDDGADRVWVAGARGEPAPEKLKVSVSFQAGWRAFGRLIVSGPDTLAKATRVADAFWDAAGGRAFYEHALHQFIGWNACHPPLAKSEPGEILIQFAVRDQDERKINTRFAPQLVPRVLASVPGISYIADQGRPRASEVIAFWPALVSRAAVHQRVVMGDQEFPVEDTRSITAQGRSEMATDNEPIVLSSARTFAADEDVASPIDGIPSTLPDDASKDLADARSTPADRRSLRVPLLKLCLARSGDKGDTANIGVIARSPAIYGWMIEHLTPAFVQRHFDDLCDGEVERFLLPNLLGMNFLLHHSLGGGGTLSLLLDAQGKTYAQYLLAAEVEIPEGLIDADSRVPHRHERLHV